MWSHRVNSVYGFKDGDGDDAIDRETAQKDHRALNRLKRNVDELKLELEIYRGGTRKETKNDVLELRTALIVNDLITTENVIILEVGPFVQPISATASSDIDANSLSLFDEDFKRIKKINSYLFHFGIYNGEDKVVRVDRDSTLYVSL